MNYCTEGLQVGLISTHLPAPLSHPPVLWEQSHTQELQLFPFVFTLGHSDSVWVSVLNKAARGRASWPHQQCAAPVLISAIVILPDG